MDATASPQTCTCAQHYRHINNMQRPTPPALTCLMTPYPARTLPKHVCRPSSSTVGETVMKNWLLLLFSMPRLATDTMKGRLCLQGNGNGNGNGSSSSREGGGGNCRLSHIIRHSTTAPSVDHKAVHQPQAPLC